MFVLLLMYLLIGLLFMMMFLLFTGFSTLQSRHLIIYKASQHLNIWGAVILFAILFSFILFYFIFFYFVVICFWFCSLLFVTIRFGSARFGTVWWGSFRFEFYENHAVNHQASLLLSLLLTSRDSSSTLFGSSTNNFTKSDISAHITAINQNNHPTPIWSINCGSILVIMYTRSQLVIVSMQRIVK